MASLEKKINRPGRAIAHKFDAALMHVLIKYGIRVPLPERNPFQLFVLLVIFVADTLVLTHVDFGPQSLVAAGAFGTATTVVIAIGSLTGIIGIVWPDREVGLAFEQYAHSVLCFGSWGYVFAVVDYSGISSGILVSGYTAGVAIGAWARACHILIFNRQIKFLIGQTARHDVIGGTSYDAS